MRCGVTWAVVHIGTWATALSLILQGQQSADRRPIITGCLSECGAPEQSCVTQCQVCVEENRCPSVAQNCSACLNETRAAARALLAAGDTLTDSGGAPLVHEGVQQRLQAARLEAMDGTRQLRRGRSEVLTAQRQAEWAVEERREAGQELRKAKEVLEEQEGDAGGWYQSNRDKIQDMQKYVDRLRRQVSITKRELRIVEENLRHARREVRRAKHISDAGARARRALVMDRVRHRLRTKLKAQEKKLSREETLLHQEKKDASWFHKGLRKEVREVARGVKRQVQDLRSARESEKLARKQLEQAKDDYREAAAASHNLSVKVVNLERELQSNPMPSFMPGSPSATA